MAAYLMVKNMWNLKETLALMRKARRIVCPNRGFINQLKKLEQKNVDNVDGMLVSNNTNSSVIE
jgi:protein-tyrosine phosphatase